MLAVAALQELASVLAAGRIDGLNPDNPPQGPERSRLATFSGRLRAVLGPIGRVNGRTVGYFGAANDRFRACTA